MCTIKKILNVCAVIIWIACTVFAEIVGMITPIKLLADANASAVTHLSVMLLCYTYIAYVIYTIDYARARWNPTKDSIYVPHNKFNIVQLASIIVMATVFIFCLVVSIFR